VPVKPKPKQKQKQKAKTKQPGLCRNFQRGTCRRGAGCRFAHERAAGETALLGVAGAAWPEPPPADGGILSYYRGPTRGVEPPLAERYYAAFKWEERSPRERKAWLVQRVCRHGRCPRLPHWEISVGRA
jgi:hypothetical protein